MLSGNNRIAAIVGVVILVGIGFFLFNPFNSNSDSTSASSAPIAVIETTYGIIVIQLFPDVAPGHVDNFVRLANEGYYDGTTFHRVIPGFMIQGGDPNSKDDDRSNDGQGGHSANGPNTFVNAEFSQDLTHKRGILSMARAQDPNSAGSQFFIVVADSNFLDRQYSIFGEVIEGMDVADKIVNVKKDSADNPLEKITMKVTIRS
ncbi:MAG: peptidylprolyl isomerase [Thaumarchaeota archaeon]|jgi:peptidyl-prolyl cis-trans isomerase B (cyclophilin B)|nr:peptidylprolyl isomerase [Nitrososphaerota archaeon]NSL75402.1 peptidylprolyl isomerase [Nitrososphaerota archaeon]NSL76992.1 peptidylprolyl isomerase [Nitrososphaerota archaeon]